MKTFPERNYLHIQVITVGEVTRLQVVNITYVHQFDIVSII